MKTENRWILPDGVQETLPPDALAVELLRRKILRTYDSWGYDLVMPPMVEYLDSLLTGTAHSLDTFTFSVVDQLSGKQMGVRSDMTPQVARIDAHLLDDLDNNERITRLCYCGHLLHTRGRGLTSSRTPLQIGAEVFGSDTVDADLEVTRLMLQTFKVVGLPSVAIDLGHVGVFRALMLSSELDASQENKLFDILQRKSIPDLQDYLENLPINDEMRDQFCQLAELNGGVEIVEEARRRFSRASDELHRSLDTLEATANSLIRLEPDTHVHCDLSELRGYSYHTGLVFAAFLPGQGKEIARGGRYDGIGEVFGNARAATGFSADLLELYQLSNLTGDKRSVIWAPHVEDSDLSQMINSLRDTGHRVVVDLSNGNLGAQAQSCDKILKSRNGKWQVEEV